MVEIVSNIANIGDYDAYVIELANEFKLEDEVTRALDNNFRDMGRILGEDQVYVQSYEDDVYEFFWDNVDFEPYEVSLPALLILDKHPQDIDAEDEGILIELGDAESEREVTRTLEDILRLLDREDFMKAFTWKQRKENIIDILKSLGVYGEVAVSLLSFI